MASRLKKFSYKKFSYTVGFYIDKDIELMLSVLAKKKKSNKSQVVREAIIRMFEQEFNTTKVESVAKRLGLL
ncbi:hypothetical protein DRN44_05935 [Thermococci archaeon]|nr:MAG: hypothetical protein DRN44_05935 [Thermococci archaeon]